MSEWGLRLVGPLTVHRDGTEHSGRSLGSRKARTLMVLLALDRGRVTTVDRIVDALWGDRPPSRPEANVATLVSRLRSVLGPHAVLGGRAGYRLGTAVRTDLDDAAELTAGAERHLARHEAALALDRAGEALRLLGSDEPLSGEPDSVWTARAAALHQELSRRAWHAMATAGLSLGDHAEAVRAARAAVVADPLDEAAYRLLMRGYQAAGEPARALRAYGALCSALEIELGCRPAPVTQRLRLAILRGGAHDRRSLTCGVATQTTVYGEPS